MTLSYSKKLSIAISITLSSVYAETTQNSTEKKWVDSPVKGALKKTSLNLDVTPAFVKENQSPPIPFSRDKKKEYLRDADLSDMEFVKKNGFAKNPAMRTVVADRLYAKRKNGSVFIQNSTRPETRPKKKKK